MSWNENWIKGASYGYFNTNKPIDLKLGFLLTEIINEANKESDTNGE